MKMKDVVFVTGNQHKADFLAKWLDVPLAHTSLDLDELQSFDLHVIAEHKARQAFKILKKPVLVEDVGMTIHELGALPGPYIKWFLKELTLKQICKLPEADRSATASICFCLFDGVTTRFFDGAVSGTIALSPRGSDAFGFNPIFIPSGSNKTWSEMDDQEIAMFGFRVTTVYPKLRKYFESVR